MPAFCLAFLHGSALSAGNLAAGLMLPEEVRRVVIAADPDLAGMTAASAARRRSTHKWLT